MTDAFDVMYSNYPSSDVATVRTQFDGFKELLGLADGSDVSDLTTLAPLDIVLQIVQSMNVFERHLSGIETMAAGLSKWPSRDQASLEVLAAEVDRQAVFDDLMDFTWGSVLNREAVLLQVEHTDVPPFERLSRAVWLVLRAAYRVAATDY